MKWFKRKVYPVIVLVWRGDWCYVVKDGHSVGHINMFINDDEVKIKVLNLLKQLEK